MALLTPPPAAPQRGDRTTFANRVDAFITWLINFVSELTTFVLSLNTLAAGGAYSLAYKWGYTIPNAVNAFGAPSNIAAMTTLIVSDVAVDGKYKVGLLNAALGSTSSVKGSIRIQKVNDPDRWAVFAVTGISDSGAGYQNVTGSVIAASDATPFAEGDGVMLFLDRAGDKGATGSSGLTPTYMYVRDERAQGTGGGTLGTSGSARTLNTVKVNTISGASLASNQVTLPAGTYEYVGSVPYAYGGAGYAHKGQLFNVTDNAAVDNGTNGSNADSSSNGYTTLSLLRGTFTIASAKAFSVRHFYTAAAGTDAAGRATGLGGVEVYTEIMFKKTA